MIAPLPVILEPSRVVKRMSLRGASFLTPFLYNFWAHRLVEYNAKGFKLSAPYNARQNEVRLAPVTVNIAAMGGHLYSTSWGTHNVYRISTHKICVALLLSMNGNMGHTPSTAGTFRKKFQKNSGKTPETLSERFLEFPSRVQLGCPKPCNSRHSRLSEHFQNSLPPSTAEGASFVRSDKSEVLSELVMEFPAVLGVSLRTASLIDILCNHVEKPRRSKTRPGYRARERVFR